MNSVITIANTVLTLLLALIPRLTDNAAVSAVIQTLVGLVPVLVKEAREVLPQIQSIIDLLRTKDLTMEQLDQLDAVSVEVDAAFDAAVTDFEKENPDGED